MIKVGTPSTRQTATIDGLIPDAVYRYQIDIEAAGMDVARAGPSLVKTFAAKSQPFRFAVYGDMRYPGHAASSCRACPPRQERYS